MALLRKKGPGAIEIEWVNCVILRNRIVMDFKGYTFVFFIKT